MLQNELSFSLFTVKLIFFFQVCPLIITICTIPKVLHFILHLLLLETRQQLLTDKVSLVRIVLSFNNFIAKTFYDTHFEMDEVSWILSFLGL